MSTDLLTITKRLRLMLKETLAYIDERPPEWFRNNIVTLVEEAKAVIAKAEGRAA